MNSLVAAVAVIVRISPGLWPADGGSEVLGSSHLAVSVPMDSAAHAPWSHLAVEAIAMLVQASLRTLSPRQSHNTRRSTPAKLLGSMPSRTCHGRGQMACWAGASISRDARGFEVCRLPHPHMHATIASSPQSCPARAPPHAVDAIRGPIAGEMETQR